jgi:hypothetical protein
VDTWVRSPQLQVTDDVGTVSGILLVSRSAAGTRVSGLFGVLRLVKLDLEIAGNLKKGNQPVTVIFNFLRELNAARFQFTYGLRDVVAVERNIAGS